MLLRFLLSLSDGLRQRKQKQSLAPHISLARLGEDIAHRYLQRIGYTVVARNFRTRTGLAELDLVAWDQGQLVFVEVKTRHSNDPVRPEERIDDDKVRNLMRGGLEYCRRSQNDFRETRVDVVSVVIRDHANPEVRLFRDALREWRSPRKAA